MMYIAVDTAFSHGMVATVTKEVRWRVAGYCDGDTLVLEAILLILLRMHWKDMGMQKFSSDKNYCCRIFPNAL